MQASKSTEYCDSIGIALQIPLILVRNPDVKIAEHGVMELLNCQKKCVLHKVGQDYWL